MRLLVASTFALPVVRIAISNIFCLTLAIIVANSDIFDKALTPFDFHCALEIQVFGLAFLSALIDYWFRQRAPP